LRPVVCARLDCVDFVNAKRFNVELGMGGKGKTKYQDPEGNHEMVAHAAATRGDYEKIETMLESIKIPSIQIYNSLIKAYIKGRVFGKIALILEKLEDNEQPDPNVETFFPLIIEYNNMGLKGHARNVLFKAAEHGCIEHASMLRLLSIYLENGDFNEVLLFLRCLESVGLYDEEIYYLLIDYMSNEGTQGFELLKRYMVHFRDITHSPIPKEFKEIMLFSSVHSPHELDPYNIMEHMLEKYPHFHEDGPNHVARHLLKLIHNGKEETDRLRRTFYRCVARGFRFSDDVVNEIVLNYYRRGDHENVFRMFQVIQRDVYQIFTETTVPIIKSALYLASEESLSIVPRLLMESVIPEDYRIALVQMMIDIANDPHKDVPIHRELNTINEYLKENTVFTPKLNFVMLDYHISQNDLEKAKDLLAMILDRYYTNSLCRNPPVFGDIEFPQELSETIETLTKSSYRNVEPEVPAPFVVPDGYDESLPKPRAYDQYLDPKLVDKYSNMFSKEDAGGRNKQTQTAEEDEEKEEKRTFSLHFDPPKPDTSKPFFSKFASEGNPASRRKDEFSHFKKTKELPEELKIRKTKINVDFDPVISEPKEAALLGRDFKTERKFHLTGLEGLTVNQPVESTSVDFFKDVVDKLPRLRVLEDLVNERFSLIDPTYDGSSSSEFEYNAINEIQERNRVTEDFSEVIDQMWESLLTHLVTNYDHSKATEVVDELITRVPFAAPPSRTLCDSLGLPRDWRAQFD